MKSQIKIRHIVCRGRLAAMTAALAFGLTSVCAQITPVGGIARDFTITNHKTGQPLRLYDYGGNIIVLDFWAYWCGPCQAAAADLEPNIVQYYRNNGGTSNGLPVQVISVSIDNGNTNQVNNFIKTYGLELVGIDKTGVAYGQFGSGSIPHLVVINAVTNATNYQTWQVLYSTAGYNREAIKAKLESVQVPPPACALASPISGAITSPPVTLTANVTAYGRNIKRVEFYDGTVLIGSKTNAPHIFHWTDASPGAKNVFARAHYGSGFVIESSPVGLTVVTGPPRIVEGPENRVVAPGGMASFTVLAGGTGALSYQWQKDETNLADDGRYSGCATACLTITSCDTGNDGSYRCIVSNAYGIACSGGATLTCFAVANPEFESGFGSMGGGSIANNWTEWEASPGVAVGYDETAIKHGGGHAQRIRVWGAGGASGGVYQRIPAVAGKTYTLGVWLRAGDTNTFCSLGVDPAGGISPSAGVRWSCPCATTNWTERKLTVTAAADHLTIYCKVVSPDTSQRSGYFDDVTTPATAVEPPRLSARRNGKALTLTWPECPGARLEQTVSLTPTAEWVAPTNSVSIVGGQKSVTVVPTGSTCFFRLVPE